MLSAAKLCVQRIWKLNTHFIFTHILVFISLSFGKEEREREKRRERLFLAEEVTLHGTRAQAQITLESFVDAIIIWHCSVRSSPVDIVCLLILAWHETALRWLEHKLAHWGKPCLSFLSSWKCSIISREKENDFSPFFSCFYLLWLTFTREFYDLNTENCWFAVQSESQWVDENATKSLSNPPHFCFSLNLPFAYEKSICIHTEHSLNLTFTACSRHILDFAHIFFSNSNPLLFCSLHSTIFTCSKSQWYRLLSRRESFTLCNKLRI